MLPDRVSHGQRGAAGAGLIGQAVTRGGRHHRFSPRRRACALQRTRHALHARHRGPEGAAKTQLPFQLQFGGDGPEEAGIICGFFGCDARPFNPLLTALPRLLHLRAARRSSAWLNHIVQAAVDESVNKRSGGESVLGRLSELMFIEVMRSYVKSLPPEQTGWLAGLPTGTSPRAVNLMLGNPSHAWTLDELAKEVPASRVRLLSSASRICSAGRRSNISRNGACRSRPAFSPRQGRFARVAAQVGYESEAAFSRAFKKLVGAPPAEWRRAHALRKKDDAA